MTMVEAAVAEEAVDLEDRAVEAAAVVALQEEGQVARLPAEAVVVVAALLVEGVAALLQAEEAAAAVVLLDQEAHQQQMEVAEAVVAMAAKIKACLPLMMTAVVLSGACSDSQLCSSSLH